MAASLTGRTLERPAFATAFAAPAFLRAMLDFEAALATAQAEEGLIPEVAARAIRAACAVFEVDLEAFVAEGKRSATLAVPLVRLLRIEVARIDPAAAQHLHHGATSQDVLDSAMAVCLRPCLDTADTVLAMAVAALARRAREHRATPMLGRTLMQPALPITVGLKLARWAHALELDRRQLAAARTEGLAVQLGGPVGALEGMDARGPAVRQRVARALGLADAPAWHVHRSAWLGLLSRITQVVITAGKIARDVALAAQPEVGEMREAQPREGVGASSAMPHKRNPVGCAHALAAAIRAPALLAAIQHGASAEQERALGGWQAELATVPELAGALGQSLDFLETIAESLVVDAERMLENLQRFGEGATVAQLACDAALEELLAVLPPGT